MAQSLVSADLSVANLFSFHRHVVLITGGATGLGEMAALAFVQNGAKVIIASRKQSELRKVSKRLNDIGPGTCEWIVADLKNKAGCEDLAKKVEAMTDFLTVLLNNAGAAWAASYEDFAEIGWDKIYALNVKAVFYTTVYLHSLLAKHATPQNPSRVINVAAMEGISTADVTVGPEGGLSPPGTGLFSYGPSKAACIHLTRLQASKLIAEHITANAICPGVFPSRTTAFGLQGALGTIISRQPSGRVGRAEDFAGLVLFLSSLGAAHLTGNVLELDGGSGRSGFMSRMHNGPHPRL